MRISPDGVHIQDSKYFHTLFSSSQKLDKLKRLKQQFSNARATNTRARNSSLATIRSESFFLDTRNSFAVPVTQSRVNRLCDRLQKEYAGYGQILVMICGDASHTTLSSSIALIFPIGFPNCPIFEHLLLIQCKTSWRGFMWSPNFLGSWPLSIISRTRWSRRYSQE